MKELLIKIAGVDYKIRQSFRSLMLFEDMTGKPVSEAVDSVNTIMLMFYCIIKANNKHFEMDFEQFVELIDNNQDSVEVFTKFLEDQTKAEPAKKKEKQLTILELFGLVVYNCNIDANYFYDEMTIKEVEVVVENYNNHYKNQWNQIRWLGFINANCAGNSIKKPEDLLLFSWEKEEGTNEILEDIESTKLKLLEILKTV